MSQFFASGGQSTGVSASTSVLPMNTQDWLDLLAVQGTLKNLLQYHSSKASILQHSAFFTVQLLHPYMTTGKTIALTRWIFVGKVMSLLFSNNRLVPNRKRSTSRLILSPCLFNLYAEYIMRNAGLEDAQAGIKIAGEISITSDMQMTPPLWQKVKRN